MELNLDLVLFLVWSLAGLELAKEDRLAALSPSDLPLLTSPGLGLYTHPSIPSFFFAWILGNLMQVPMLTWQVLSQLNTPALTTIL